MTTGQFGRRETAVLWWGLGAATAVCLATLLPFVRKAYNIDDLTFLLQAQHMRVDPLHPTAFDMVFHGQVLRLSKGLVSGPVMATLLLPSVLLGGAEWLTHLIQLGLLLVSALFTARLGRRLGLTPRESGVAALFMVAAPGVLAMAGTAMPDVPALCFLLVGIERLLCWKGERRPLALAAAVGALALAVLARPHALLGLGIAALLWTDDEDWQRGPRAILRRSLGALPPLLLSLGLLLLVNRLTRDPQAGRDVAGATLSRLMTRWFWHNLATIPAQWLLTFPLALPWIAADLRGFLRRPSTWLSLLLGGYLGMKLGMGTLPPAYARPFAVVVTGLGSAVLMDILLEGLWRRDRVQVALGLWLLISLPATFYDHLPVKYLVPSAPAMAILLVRRYRERAPGWLGPMAVASAVVGMAIAVLVLRADASLAEIGRRGGLLVAKLRASEPAAAVWMDGAWGFQWYAVQAGAKPMTQTPPYPRPGDLVVVGPQGGRINLIPRRKLIHVERYTATAGWVLGHGAGFFTNGFGALPWSVGPGELGRIEAWRVE
jgi:hypothetical protein